MCGSAPVVMRPVNDSDQNGAVVDEGEAAEAGHGSSRVASGDEWAFFLAVSFIYINKSQFNRVLRSSNCIKLYIAHEKNVRKIWPL